MDKVKLPLVCWASKEKIAIRDYIYNIDVYETGLILSLDYLDGQYGLLKVAFQNFSIGEITEAEFFAHILVPVNKLTLTWIEKCMVSTIQCQDCYSAQTSLVLYEDQVEDSKPVMYTPMVQAMAMTPHLYCNPFLHSYLSDLNLHIAVLESKLRVEESG